MDALLSCPGQPGTPYQPRLGITHLGDRVSTRTITGWLNNDIRRGTITRIAPGVYAVTLPAAA